MAGRLRTSINIGLNNGLRQSISGGVAVALVLKNLITQGGDQLITQSGDTLTGNVRQSVTGGASGQFASAVALAFLEYTTVANTSTFTLRAASGSNNYEVDWGDGTVQSYTSTAPTHTYASAETYTIKITPAEGSTYNPQFTHALSETSIAEIDGTGGTSLTSLYFGFWGASNLTSISSNIDTSNVTNFRLAFAVNSSLTTFPLIDTSSGTDFGSAWYGCSGIGGSFPLINTSSGTEFGGAWRDCSGITTFPLINTSSGTSFNRAWNNCSGLTTFPVLDTSSGTNFGFAWNNCSGLTTFPALDFSSATEVGQAWNGCSDLVSFPSVDFSSVTGSFRRTWYFDTSLTTYPANQFDNISSTPSNGFQDAWRSCALTAQSIENILTSLDTNGQQNIQLGINGGTNAAKTTWSTAANTAYNNLITKGWTISFNS